MMGSQLIEVGRQVGLKKFVAIGTICAYPKYAPIPFKEDDLWAGYPEETNAPYGLAKKMMLVQSQAYREQYGFNSIVLFPVNLYGPRDNFDLETSHVIPALIRKCAEAQQNGKPEIVLWGDGTLGFHGRILWDHTKPNGQPRRCLDVSRIKQTIGFQAMHSLRDGLKKTIQWYRVNRDALREVRF
jgi:GDP-L-fucose synthase